MATATISDCEVVLSPQLTERQAVEIFAQGDEAVVFAVLELARGWARAEGQCASLASPATPSGMKPVHQKPTTQKRGESRGIPAAAASCRSGSTSAKRIAPPAVRTAPANSNAEPRRARDTPKTYRPTSMTVVTQHTIHRDWCPRCKKSVESAVPNALLGSQIGNRPESVTLFTSVGLAIEDVALGGKLLELVCRRGVGKQLVP